MTTMASSTTMPMASTSPKSVSTLMEKPSSVKPRKVPITLTGTARIGINVARQLCRKRNTTRVTRSIASPSVFTTSLIDAVMNGVVSNGMAHPTPGGKLRSSSFIRATNAFRTSSWLAPDRRNTSIGVVGLPFSRPARSALRDTSSTVATSPTRIMAPLGSARTMTFSNSAGVRSRPSAVTGRVISVPGGAGSRPSAPAGLVAFCSRTAAWMSVTVRPSWAMRSGSRRIVMV